MKTERTVLLYLEFQASAERIVDYVQQQGPRLSPQLFEGICVFALLWTHRKTNL